MIKLNAINDLKRHTLPIERELSAATSRVINSGWFAMGPEVNAFEAEFSEYLGIENTVSLANGTDALRMALLASGATSGSKVLTVANAGMYSTVAILGVNATPIYTDVHYSNALIDEEKANAIIASGKVDIVIVTHLYGMMADIASIVDTAKRHNVIVIEDCAQSHGAIRGRAKSGTIGDIGCFSFYPTKNLGALGDGGAIVTNSSKYANIVRKLRQYGWGEKYNCELENGENSRLDEIQAAILRVKLPRLDVYNKRRRDIARSYVSGIRNTKVELFEMSDNEDYVAHLFVLKVRERELLANYLRTKGIPCDIHYPIADYKQQSCSYKFNSTFCPVTERLTNEVLTLPCFPEMENEEINYIIDCVNEW